MVNPKESNITENARHLQEQLHKLLSKLTDTTDFIKNWPEAKGGDGSMHVERTSQLMTKIHTTVTMLQKVEGCLQQDVALRETFQQCLIPLDLLDMLDSSKLNPDCFLRGLLREALGQLAGLKRRKLALELLGAAVAAGQSGDNQSQIETPAETTQLDDHQTNNEVNEVSRKRDCESIEDIPAVDFDDFRKRIKLEPETTT